MKLEILHNGAVVETKTLTDGQYKLGRGSDSDLVLNSARVSKHHGMLVIKDGRAAILDSGSANGIFVNGVLIKKQRIEIGDIVDIGDYQIRVVREFRAVRKAASGGGNLAENLDFGGGEMGVEESQPAPKNGFSPDRVEAFVEAKVMPPFYDLVKLVEWRFLLAGILLASLVLSVLLSSRPLYVWARELTSQEALERAHTVVAQLVRENYRVLQKGTDMTRLTVEIGERAKGFASVYIVDPETRNVVAPANLFNKTINDSFALLALQRILDEGQSQVTIERRDGTYIVAQPIPGVPTASKTEEADPNRPSGVVLGQFSVAGSITSTFEPILEALIFSVFFAFLAYYLIYRMVARPITQMQEQLDQALKGEDVLVNCEAKFGELETLAQVINFSISRLRQATGAPIATSSSDSDQEDAGYAKSIQELDFGTTDALLLLDKDKKVRFVGRVLEDLIGLRDQYAQGQNISDASRDAGFAGTVIDLCERVSGSLGESQTATLDINGTNRVMSAIGHRGLNGEIRFFLVIVKMGN